MDENCKGVEKDESRELECHAKMEVGYTVNTVPEYSVGSTMCILTGEAGAEQDVCHCGADRGK